MNIIKHKIISNGIYYVIGGILIQGINFFSLPIFTRILSPEDFGIVSLYNVWMNTMSIFICLQIYGSLGNAKTHFLKNEYIKYKNNILILSIIIFLFWALVFILFNGFLEKILNLEVRILFCLLFHSFFLSIINFKLTDLLFEEKPKKRLFISFINIVLTLSFSIFMIIFILDDSKYFGRIIGGMLSTSIIGTFICYKDIRFKNLKLNFIHWKFALKITIPLIFHNLSHIILGNSNKIMLERYRGLRVTGIYSFALTLGVIINILWIAFNSAWIPWFYENMKIENYFLIKKYSKIYLRFFTYICIGFLIMTPEVIKIMGSKNYASAELVLPYLVLGYYFIFLYSFPVNYEFFHRKTVYIAIGTTGAAVINVILNYFFIPRYEAFGSALATVISYFCMFLFHEFIMRKILKHKILNIKNYIEGILIMLLSIMIFLKFIDKKLIRYIFLLIVSICYLCYFYTIYRKKPLIRIQKSHK